MYNKGDLKLTTPLCAEAAANEDSYCECQYEEILHEIGDSRGSIEFQANTAYLPHSCDEWVIGGAKEIELMIADLQAILTEMGKV